MRTKSPKTRRVDPIDAMFGMMGEIMTGDESDTSVDTPTKSESKGGNYQQIGGNTTLDMYSVVIC